MCISFVTLITTCFDVSRLMPCGLVAHVCCVPLGKAFCTSCNSCWLIAAQVCDYHVANICCICCTMMWIVWCAVFRTVHAAAAIDKLCDAAAILKG